MADSSVYQCLAIIRELQSTLSSARGAFMDKETCVVNRELFQTKLAQLSSTLPGAMKLASEYVSNINAIRQQTEQDCETQMRAARQQSAQIVSDAQQNASSAVSKAEQTARDTLARAQAEAEEIKNAARSEAARLTEEAQRAAELALSKEDILRRARVAASELRESTELDMAALRQQTFDYLDIVTDGFDRHLSEMLTNLRRERAKLNGMR